MNTLLANSCRRKFVRYVLSAWTVRVHYGPGEWHQGCYQARRLQYKCAHGSIGTILTPPDCSISCQGRRSDEQIGIDGVVGLL